MKIYTTSETLVKKKVGVVLNLLTFLMFISIGTRAQKLSVQADRGLETDLSRYSTFMWSSQIEDNRKGGQYFLNDLILKADVRDAVKGALEADGYKFAPQSADLIINFRLFDKAVTLSTPDTYGLLYWNSNEIRWFGDMNTRSLSAGTLILSVIDTEAHSLVWQGYLTGLATEDGLIKDEATIREGVNLMIQEMLYPTIEYSKR